MYVCCDWDNCESVHTKYFLQVYELKQKVENKLLILRKEIENDQAAKATLEKTKKVSKNKIL